MSITANRILQNGGGYHLNICNISIFKVFTRFHDKILANFACTQKTVSKSQSIHTNKFTSLLMLISSL